MMKVKDLIKELKKLDQNAEVFLVKDWEQVEDGVLTDRYLLNDICEQTVVIDEGLDFVDYKEVILCFDEERYD